MTDHPNHRDVSTLPAELQDPTVTRAAVGWIERHVAARVAGTVLLDGASSTAVHRIDLTDGRAVVIKRYVWKHFVETEPEAPAREVDAMTHARAHHVPAPVTLAFDADGSEVGDRVPSVLMSFLPGRALSAPDPRRLAEAAAQVHDVSTHGFGHAWFRWYAGVEKQPPPNAVDARLWERAIEVWNEGPAAFEPRFIHRDLHPGNVLFGTDGVITGIVDWANACVGPVGCDIAHCRWNLIRLSGPSAADAFSDAYAVITGAVPDPVWEITSVLEHSLHELTDQHVALAEPRLAIALAQLGR